MIIHYGWTISNAGIKATEGKAGAGVGVSVTLEDVPSPDQCSLGVQGWCHLLLRLSAKKMPEPMTRTDPEASTQGKQEQRALVPPCSQCSVSPWPLVSPLSLTSWQHQDSPLQHCNFNIAAALRFVRGARIMLLCFT